MFSALALLLALGVAVPAIEPAKPLKNRNGQLMFVTASRLNEPRSSDLTKVTSPAGWSTYRRLLEKRGVAQGAPSKCLRPPLGHVLPAVGDKPHQRTFATEVQNNSVAVTGQVEGITFGWHFDDNGVAALVRLRIDEVLKDSTGDLVAGLVVTYLQPGGLLHASGRTICTEDPEYIAPKVGDRVILLGALDPANELHLMTHPSLIYYVRGAEVTSGETQVHKVRRLSVDDVYAAVRSAR